VPFTPQKNLERKDIIMKNLFIILLSIMCLVMVSGNAFAGSADADAQAGASITTIDQSHSKIYNRQFVTTGITPIPGTNGFFTAPTPDSSFRQVQDLIFYLTGDPEALSVHLTEGALENLAKGGDVEANVQVIRAELAKAKADEDGTKWLTISYIAPVVKDGKLIGVRKEKLDVGAFADGEADDGDTNSFMVIGRVGLKAMYAGFDHLQITSEGAHRKVKASGWGVGTYTVGGSISDSGKTSGLVGGGLGYASNETGTEDQPWIQGNVGMSK
jgi:hypothetical protein